MFKYVISVFSPSWEGNGTEGRVVLYSGSDRAKAINAWHLACDDMWPQAEVIVLGREQEHYNRINNQDELDCEESDPDVVTWTFADGYKCYGLSHMLSGYEKDVIMLMLGHGQLIRIDDGYENETPYICDVISAWVNGKIPSADCHVEIYAKNSEEELLLCTTHDCFAPDVTVSGMHIAIIPDNGINIPDTVDSYWRFTQEGSRYHIDDIGSMSHYLYMKEIHGSCIRIYNPITEIWEYEQEYKKECDKHEYKFEPKLTVCADEDLPF